MTQNQWQPIETAPKDGTQILLCRAFDADGNRIEPLGIFAQCAQWWGIEEGWVVYCSMVREPLLHFEPTHWMPLPQPPTEKAT